VAESAETFLGTPSLDLADMLASIQSGKRPGMQSRDSQGHLQTIREQTARGGRNSRALVTNTTPCEKPGQVARRGSPDGSYGYSPGSRECSRCPDCTLYPHFREHLQGEVRRIYLRGCSVNKGKGERSNNLLAGDRSPKRVPRRCPAGSPRL
jgi:hypothetical protein